MPTMLRLRKPAVNLKSTIEIELFLQKLTNIQKFIQKLKGCKKANIKNNFGRLTLPNFTTCCKAVVIKIVC